MGVSSAVEAESIRESKIEWFPQLGESPNPYLLANTARLSSEDCIPAQQACKEAIISAFFPGATWYIPEKYHRGLVNHGKCGEVPRMLAGCFQNELRLFAYAK